MGKSWDQIVALIKFWGQNIILKGFGVKWKYWKILGVDMQFVDKLLWLICNFGKLWFAGIGLSKKRFNVELKLIFTSNAMTTPCLCNKS